MSSINQQKTVLLLGINARYSHSNPALYYLREFCRDLDYRITIHEVSIKRTIPELLEEIVQAQPDVLGISVYIWNTLRVRELVRSVRALLPGCTIVLGGPEVSYTADDWITELPEIDYVVTGPGEAGFRRLLENGLQLPGRIIDETNPPFKNIPFLYRHEDFSRFRNRYVYYEASRGCPFRCSYCLSSRRDQALDFRDLDDVKHELNHIISRGPGTVKFVDRTFNADRRFAREIWRHCSKYSSPARFHFEIFPELLEDEDFRLLSEIQPGRFQLEIGIQSTNPDTLKEIHRPCDWDTVSKNVRRLVELGTIHIHLDLIAGLPFEDLDSFISSFNRVYALGGHYLQLGFLKILPGTEMESRKNRYRIKHLEMPPYTVQETRWLSRGHMADLKRVEYVLNYLYNSGRYGNTLTLMAEHFSSPYEMYHTLADFLDRKKRKKISRDWVTGANAILHLAEQQKPHIHAEILQNLRKDWDASMQGMFPLGKK